MNNISVIIPVKEEMKLQFHHKIIESYKSHDNIELVWVVGPNHDGSYENLIELGQNVIQTTSNSRAERMNIGIKATHRPLVLLNHPRSFLSEKAINQLSSYDLKNEKVWGGFTHEFYRSHHPVLNFTSFYSNVFRFDGSGIVYLDHCIFFTRNMISRQDPEPVPQVDIFEDTLLSEKLLKQSAPLRIKEKSYTSPVRFISNGIFRQAVMNQKLKLQFRCGVSKESMNKNYEKDLNLNSEY